MEPGDLELNLDLNPGPNLDLIGALRHGLPLAERPYAVLGESLGMDEAEVIARIRSLTEAGAISRFGVVVRHHAVGFDANAMVVWDVPDDRVDALGRELGRRPGVNLCYRRPRRPPRWSYNLFTMIHARDRETVRRVVADMVAACGLEDIRHELLFTARRFKQTAACYGRTVRDRAAE